MKKHEQSPITLAMRIYERVKVRAKHNSDFLMCDMADGLIEEFGMSRATAFRYIRSAIDVLGIPYDKSAGRKALMRERMSEGHANAKLMKFPNGKPGGHRVVYA